jgi:hypothetical protein
MMEAASISEMPVNFHQIMWFNNPENSHLHSHHCENLKSHHAITATDTINYFKLMVFQVQKQEENYEFSV